MLKKQYLKTKDVFRTTFRLSETIANEADCAQLVGEFNNWGKGETIEMQKLKNGSFKAVIDLPEGEYQFKYLVDQDRWENDDEADLYVEAPYGGENSVVRVYN